MRLALIACATSVSETDGEAAKARGEAKLNFVDIMTETCDCCIGMEAGTWPRMDAKASNVKTLLKKPGVKLEEPAT